MMDVLCFGCGDNLSWKSNDRRNLESDSLKPVLELWKTLFIQELNDKEIVTHETQEVLTASICGEARLPDL